MGGALGGTSLIVLLVLVTVGMFVLKPGPGLLPRALFILTDSDRTQAGPVRSSCEKKRRLKRAASLIRPVHVSRRCPAWLSVNENAFEFN